MPNMDKMKNKMKVFFFFIIIFIKKKKKKSQKKKKKKKKIYIFNNKKKKKKKKDKLKKKNKAKIFGGTLDPHADFIPLILIQTVDYLDKTGLKIEGLFRKSGNQQLIENLTQKFDKREFVDLNLITDPHTISGLLKRWFRELSEPLLTFELVFFFFFF